MRSTEEQHLSQIFERKNKFIEQIKHHTLQFDQLLASKLLIHDIFPPPWLSYPHFSSRYTNPNGLSIAHLQPAISCSSSHFPLCNGNHPDIEAHHSELRNDSFVEFRASSVGVDAGEELSALPQCVTDRAVDAFGPILEQDTDFMSPHHQKDAQNLGILQENLKSLVKIQRSKSRQRALELRNSAKAAKSCMHDEDNAITDAIIGSGIALLQSDNPNVLGFLQAVENNSERSSIEDQADDCGSKEKNCSFSFGIVTRSKSSGHQSKSTMEVVCGCNSPDVAHECDAKLAKFGSSSVQTSNNLTQLVEHHFSICDKKYVGEDKLSYESMESSVSGRIKGLSSSNPEPAIVIESLKKETFLSNGKKGSTIKSVQVPNHVIEINKFVRSSRSPLGEHILEERDGVANLSFTYDHLDVTNPFGSPHHRNNSRKRSLQHQDSTIAGTSKENSSDMRSSRSKRSKKSGQEQSSLQMTKTEGSSPYVANKNDAGLAENVDVPLEPLKPPVSSETRSVEQARQGEKGSKDRKTRSKSSILLIESMDGSPNQHAGLQKPVVEDESGLSKENETKYSSRITMSNRSARQRCSGGTAGNLINDENYNNGTLPQYISKAVNECIEVLNPFPDINESHQAEEAKMGDRGSMEKYNSCRLTRARSSRLSEDTVNEVINNDSFSENGKEELVSEFTEEPDNVGKLKESMEEKVDDCPSKDYDCRVYSGRITRSRISGKQHRSTKKILNMDTSYLESEGDPTPECHESEFTEASKKVNKSIKQLTPSSHENNGVSKAEAGKCKIIEKENNGFDPVTRSGISGVDQRKSLQDPNIFGDVTEQTEQDPNNISDVKEHVEARVDQSYYEENCSGVLIGRMTRSKTSCKKPTSANKTLKGDGANKLLINLKEILPRNSLEDLKNFGKLQGMVEENMDWCWSKEHGNSVLSDIVSRSGTSYKHPTTAKENLNVGYSFVANDLQLNSETIQPSYCIDKSMELLNHPISNKVTGTQAIDVRRKENETISLGISAKRGSSSLQPDHESDIVETVGLTVNGEQYVGSRPSGEPKHFNEINQLAGDSFNPMDMLIQEEKQGGANTLLASKYKDVEIGNHDGVPMFESFIMNADDQTHISEDGLCLEGLVIPESTLSSASKLCKSACLSPLSHDSSTFRIPEAPSSHQPIPDHHINVDFSYLDKDVLTSYSDCLPCSSHESSWCGEKPCRSPVKRVWDSILSFSGSSGKRRSLNLDLPSIREENEITDAVADAPQEEFGSYIPSESAMLEPLADITEVITNVDSSMHTLNADIDFLGTSIKGKLTNQSGNGRGSSRLRGNHITSLGANVKQTPGLSNGKRSKARVSGKPSLRGGRSYSEKGSKPNNIVSTVTSFIPLVQHKQATAVATGKREIKVKALEAAEAAKRLAEKKENERKVRKEALKVERVKQAKENLRQLELEKKKKEEERNRKESEMAARKRQRVEEEKGIKERGRKRKRLEETQKQLRGHEENLGGEKGNKVSKNSVDGIARVRNDFKNGTGKIKRVEEGQVNGKGYLPEILPGGSDGDASESIDNHLGVDVPAVVITDAEEATNNEHEVMNTVKEQSYEMSPFQHSDDEEDDNNVPNRKFIPSWASKSILSMSVFSQQSLDPDAIFPSGSFSLADKVCFPIKL